MIARHNFWTVCFFLAASARLAIAQDDLGVMRMMREAFEHNPELRAIRDRNMEREPVCPAKLDQAPKAAGTDAGAWRAIGRCSLKQEKATAAEEAFQRAAQLEPTGETYSLLGLALVREGKLSEVTPILRKAAALDPHEDQLFRAWGAYYLAQGDLNRAASYYAKALEMLHPDGLGLFEVDHDYATLARIYARMGDHQAAVAAYQQECFADDCFNDQTTYQYGLELLATGQRERVNTLISWAELTNKDLATRLRGLTHRR